jgi:hypothetical protein
LTVSQVAAKRRACDVPAHRREFRRLFLGRLIPSRARFRFAGYFAWNQEKSVAQAIMLFPLPLPTRYREIT